MTRPIITLLTDFGTTDHYVAAMKGVILTIAPQANLIDITHQLAPQIVMSGAFILHNTLPWFPPGTIHVVVVDPGVGSERRVIAGSWREQIIVAPDNGLVSFVQHQHPAKEIHEVTNSNFFLPEVSRTFHGRDIIAPTAAYLAIGRPLSSVGPAIEQPSMIDLPQPRQKDDSLIGEIIHVDSFGNLITNITSAHTDGFKPSSIRLGEHTIPCISKTYDGVPQGAILALIGSSGHLEIAVNRGNAHVRLNAEIGDPVELRH